MAKLNRLYKEHNFNAYVSDMISVNRSIPDIRSQSFISLDELKSPLREAVSTINVLRLVRTKRHEGLIRARLIGVQHSVAPVMIFLDAHVECFEGWLEPLIHRVLEKPDSVICPVLHTISSKNFKIIVHDTIYVGSFRLSDLVFDWIPIQQFDQLRRTSDIDVIRSPAFAGGIFAIQRKYFHNIGGYDAGMNLWGGENIEMSLRIWLCGGSVDIHPCSHIAHLFRQTNPLENDMKKELDSAAMRNNLRLAAVWMGHYKEYYNEPGLEKIDVGNISERLELKKRLNCRTFDWYIQNVYPGLYIPGQAERMGHIRNVEFDVCIDSGLNLLTSRVNALPCSNKSTQFWHLSKLNALQNDLGCIGHKLPLRANIDTDDENHDGDDDDDDDNSDNSRCSLERCDGGGVRQSWIYTKEQFLYNKFSNRCLGYMENKDGEWNLKASKCKQDTRFYWTWNT
ncbi:Polypeptide N-acetylgalactosaminyltransferase 4 [Mactra antiquata]